MHKSNSPSNRRKIVTPSEAGQRIVETARTLEVLQCLQGANLNRVKEATAVMQRIETSKKRQTYKLFLHDVSNACGSHMALLCAASLGKVNIINMRKGQRKSLIDELQYTDLPVGRSTLESLAKVHGFPCILKDPAVCQQSQFDPNRDVSPEEVTEYASLAGITIIFNAQLCDAIRKVPVSTISGISMKASVTTIFPLWGGPVHSLMSLDIHDWGVEKLALALFDARVRWIEKAWHVDMNDGMSIAIPNAEATLKGARDGAIIETFGSDIFEAINESPIRQRERQELKNVTECVSMILTKNGAIVNLSLGLEKALEIRSKLCT